MDKFKSQALRFGRLTVTTAVASWLLTGAPLNKAAVIGVLIGAAEVTVRQVWPTVPVPDETSVPERPAENA